MDSVADIMNEEIGEAGKEGKSYRLLSEMYKAPRVVQKLKERLGMSPEQAAHMMYGASNIDDMDSW